MIQKGLLCQYLTHIYNMCQFQRPLKKYIEEI